jgi:hypothetical protein
MKVDAGLISPSLLIRVTKRHSYSARRESPRCRRVRQSRPTIIITAIAADRVAENIVGIRRVEEHIVPSL